MPAKQQRYTTKISKLIHGGQGLGRLDSGQKALVWGALPGEEIAFISTKKRKDFVEGIADDVLHPSPLRIKPQDAEYLSTSPWQIMSESIEDETKSSILQETFERAGVHYQGNYLSVSTADFYGYRNKMEYSFYGDDTGLHLALFNRGTHHKQIVTGSSIAKFQINDAAQKIVALLKENNVRASDLKTLVLRASQDGTVAAALYVKDEDFAEFPALGDTCGGVAVVYSNPKSPASIKTRELYRYGTISLSDLIDTTRVEYDVYSFFQVNVPVFVQAVKSIAEMIRSNPAIDLYSGVGSIGLALDKVDTLVESDQANIVWAEKNAAKYPSKRVIHAPSEQALSHITTDKSVIVDPPRAGLHGTVVSKLLEAGPENIVYLSCNPSTQARDIERLQTRYRVNKVECYNFFPRTPHIESLVHLVLR